MKCNETGTVETNADYIADFVSLFRGVSHILKRILVLRKQSIC